MPKPSDFRLPRILGTQLGLRNPEQIDKIKSDMRARQFVYQENRIAGVIDRKGIYYVTEGHHRMAAALEIYRETGDSQPIQQLLAWGSWSEVVRKPVDRRPLPSRHWWGSFRNWLGY